jgi:SAM-dependent methyltransferase
VTARASTGLGAPTASLADANATAIARLENLVDTVPAGLDEGRYRAAVEYALGRYRVGLDHYHRAVRRASLDGHRDVLDVGSGAGHWCVALAAANQSVQGVEPSLEYVAIAEAVVGALGLGERISFTAATAEAAELPAESFDCVCCHSVLMFTEHETTVRNVRRWIRDGSPFYVGYTSAGSRLKALSVGAAKRNWNMLEVNTRALLGQELYRCGLNRTPGTRTRTFSPDELVRLVSALGFDERARPGVQDGIPEFAGYPGTIDFVFEAVAGAPAQRRLETLEGEAWLRAGEELVDTGLPRLVLESIDERGTRVSTPEDAALYARALVKAGRVGTALEEALGVLGRGGEHAVTRGLARHEEWDYAGAQEAYEAAPPSHPDGRFLLAHCLLQLGRHEDAERLYTDEEEATDGLRGWLGRLAVAVELRDEKALDQLIRKLPPVPEAREDG